MMSFFKFFTKKQSKANLNSMKKFLIVGLGNIGEKYANTRHNIGFQILDALAKDQDVRFETEKLGDITRFRYKGKSFILLKPSTFMNLSGKAVKYWMTKEKIQLDNICIVTDDKNIDFGAVRIKTKGSAGGHNGLKDIQEKLQTQQYTRFRFGIGGKLFKRPTNRFCLRRLVKRRTKSAYRKNSSSYKSHYIFWNRWY
jgi:PTH1 family peptidyl-tRNA hydrolase